MLIDSFFYSSLLCLAALAVKRLAWAGKPTPLFAYIYVLSFHFFAFFIIVGAGSGRWKYAAVMMLGAVIATIAYRHLSGDAAHSKSMRPRSPQTASRVRGPEDYPNWPDDLSL
jgi:hypothetical protein